MPNLLQFFLSLLARPPGKLGHYRTFRSNIIAIKFPQGSMSGREKILFFREELAANGIAWTRKYPAYEALILRGLGIPFHIPMLKPLWIRVLLSLFLLPVSEAWKIRQLQAWVNGTKTSQGKEMILKNWPSLRPLNIYFDKSTDLSLKQVREFGSYKELETISYMRIGHIRAALGLGISNASQIIKVAAQLRNSVDADLIAMLVEEKIIVSVDDLFFLPKVHLYHSNPITDIEKSHVRSTVRLLYRAGVSLQTIMGIFAHAHNLDPKALSRRLAQLNLAGVTDIDMLYKELQTVLWQAPDSVFKCLIDDMGVVKSEDIILFKSLLHSGKSPAVPILKLLIENGATVADLIQCQDMLIKTASIANPPTKRIEALRHPPFNMSWSDVGQCSRLVSTGIDSQFDDYLSTLLKHNLKNSNFVIGLQNCYASMGYSRLDERLALALEYFPELKVQTLSIWILETTGVDDKSLAYLFKKLNVSTNDDLNRIAKIARIDNQLLIYIIESKRFNDVSPLYKWYQAVGRKVEHRLGSSYSLSERELFKDADIRANFLHLASNVKCIFEAISEYIDARLPWLPHTANEEDKAQRTQARNNLGRIADAKVAPQLISTLRQTQGVLLYSIIDAILNDSTALGSILAACDPLIDDLIKGRGPTGHNLSRLEMDATALVYGIPSSTVKQYWPSVCDRQNDLKELQLAAVYKMKWAKKATKLANLADTLLDNGTADKLQILAEAAAYAQAILQTDSLSKGTLFKKIKSSILNNKAAEISDIKFHIGLLLAIINGNELAKSGQWLESRLPQAPSMLDDSDRAFENLNELSEFFQVTLHDVLAIELTKFSATLGSDNAEVLLKQLINKKTSAESLLITLEKAIEKTAILVKTLISAWLKRALKHDKFIETAGEEIEVIGVVSKYPAAFFARTSAALCTRANTDMWAESRHSHFLVFDLNSRRLVGMAMFYFQTIAGHYQGEKCLVVRAINPIEQEMGDLDATSVIDEVMRIAIEIAKENQLACVSFTDASDNFSNRNAINNAISKSQLTKQSKIIGAQGLDNFKFRSIALFHCREQHSHSDVVSSLKVIWERDNFH